MEDYGTNEKRAKNRKAAHKKDRILHHKYVVFFVSFLVLVFVTLSD
jgi:hypothetical protein